MGDPRRRSRWDRHPPKRDRRRTETARPPGAARGGRGAGAGGGSRVAERTPRNTHVWTDFTFSTPYGCRRREIIDSLDLHVRNDLRSARQRLELLDPLLLLLQECLQLLAGALGLGGGLAGPLGRF